MEKYVIPPIFNLDFKFPASLLLLQQLRQVQKSQRLSQLAVARVRLQKFISAGRHAAALAAVCIDQRLSQPAVAWVRTASEKSARRRLY